MDYKESAPLIKAYMFKIDTNRINARQKCPYMNQIEEWHKNGIINVLISKTASLEALQGNNNKRIEKTYGYIISDIHEDNPDKSNADYSLIEKILFPCGAKDDNQKNDVKIVCEAKHSNCILITNEGASKKQPGGILGNREKLKAMGVIVMRAEEAVSFIKKLIEENDDLTRKFSEETKEKGELIKEGCQLDVNKKVPLNVEVEEKKLKFRNWIFSCGIIPLREFILGKMGIVLYGTFKRPKEWPDDGKCFNFIDRIGYVGRHSIEFQYPRNYKNLLIRECPENTHTYGAPYERLPSWSDVKLFIASNFFWRWLFMRLIGRIGG